MDPRIAKALKVSDGVASLAHKKVMGLVRELQGEGALTSEEGKKVIDGLTKVKKALCDTIIIIGTNGG